MSDDQLIPEAAQVSAEIAYLEAYMKSNGDHIRSTRAALEAAAPHMLAGIDKDIDGELQDAEPSNYEEDNYDAGYIAGLTYAQDKLRDSMRPTT